MAFTAKDVAALRERTGCGMMDCKKALTESNGDMEAAVDLLREKGLAAAAKKSGRIAAEGIVVAIADDTKKVGVVIEINSETDFVAKNPNFQAFAQTCAQTIIDKNPADVETLLEETATGSNEKIADLLREKILTIGENIKLRRFERFEGDVATYIHGGGRIGVLVKFETANIDTASDAFKAFAKDIAMQIAAAIPLFLDAASVPPETLDREKKILTEQVLNEGKPAAIAEKIVGGKIAKYYKENCLLDQMFIKDNEITVTKYVENTAAAMGGSIAIKAFVRFEKGEGLQKREDNFADEIASMMK